MLRDVNLQEEPRKMENSMASRFITNDGNSLTNTVKSLINTSKQLDFLVGFFYFSGFAQIYKDIKDLPLRILVGMDADVDVANRMREYYTYFGDGVPCESKLSIKNKWFDQVVDVVCKTDSIDTQETLEAFNVFKEKLFNGTLEVRKTSEPNHSKMYLFSSVAPDPISNSETGKVIVGSSNFSIQGLKARNEINVYLQDDNDFQEAKAIFEELWKSSVVLVDSNNKDEFFEKVISKTWLDMIPRPYLMYIRVLLEYFKANEEKILTPNELSKDSLTEFFNVSYQIDAIRDGVAKVRKHSGCIIADVVGLGKSIIASSIAANLELSGDVQRTVIICPPHLKSEWETYAQSFYLKGAAIYTPGKIEQAAKDYKAAKNLLVIIDEAHRYRNEDTQDYADLHELCAGNKVLLLSATPFNNSPADIFAMIKLFQIPSNSTIQTVNDLSKQMSLLMTRYKDLKKDQRAGILKDDDFEKKASEIARNIRDILDPVVIRRTRIDLMKHNGYRKDLKKRGIEFAKVNPPVSQSYELGNLSKLYIETLEVLDPSPSNGTVKGFMGARYQPLTYLRDNEDVVKKYAKMFDMDNFQFSQRNVAKFMKQLLVCRFESSKEAFVRSLTNILKSMEKLKKIYCEYHIIPLDKKGKLFDKTKLEDLDDDFDGSLFEYEEFLNMAFSEEMKKGLKFIDANDLNSSFLLDLNDDIALFRKYLKKWKAVTVDPKLTAISNSIKQSLAQEPKRKIIVFSEFSDTAEYLCSELEKQGIRVYSYSGKNAGNGRRDVIRANFDAGYASEMRDDYDVLVGTDAISEGISLHRAGTIYNYDIPYNPTRVIQRVGRINRMNKKVFDELYIYNFFPTATGEAVSHKSEISTFKIKLIQAILGSDTQILTDDEEINGYFAKQFDDAFAADDTVSWDIEYRNELEEIKNNYPELIKEAESLPQRSRVARKNVDMKFSGVEGNEYFKPLHDNGVFLFTRKGDSFRFSSDDDEIDVLPPQQALAIFKAKPEEEGFKVTDEFYLKYQKAKAASGLVKTSVKKTKSLQDANKVLVFLKKQFLMQIDKDYLDSVIKTVNLDCVSLFNLKRIKRIDPKSSGAIKELREIVSEEFIQSVLDKITKIESEPEVVLLSEEMI